MTFSVRETLKAAWGRFASAPLIFVGISMLILIANLVVSGLQYLIESLGLFVGGGEGVIATLMLVIAAAVGIGLSFLISICKTAFYLRAHDSVEGVTLRSLWHPQPYWKFVGTSLLMGIAIFLGLILLIIPGIILGIIFGFALYLVVEEHLSPVEALKESARLTKGNRWKMFLLGVAIVGINILGLLALVVGLLVTLPVSTLAVVHAYRTLKNAQLPAVVDAPQEVTA